MTLAKIAKGSGFAGTGVNGGVTEAPRAPIKNLCVFALFCGYSQRPQALPPQFLIPNWRASTRLSPLSVPSESSVVGQAPLARVIFPDHKYNRGNSLDEPPRMNCRP